MRLYTCLFLSNLFHWAKWSQCAFMLSKMRGFLFYVWIIFHCAIMCMCNILFFFVHLFIGDTSCFHALAIISDAAINMEGCRHLLESVFSFSSDKYPELVLFNHMTALFLVFWRTPILLSVMATPMYIHTNSALRFLFLAILATLVISCLSYNSHSNRCEVIFHCSFDLQLPDDQ